MDNSSSRRLRFCHRIFQQAHSLTTMVCVTLLLSWIVAQEVSAFSNNHFVISPLRQCSTINNEQTRDRPNDCPVRCSQILFSSVQTTPEIASHNVTDGIDGINGIDGILIHTKSKRSKVRSPKKKNIRNKKFSAKVPTTEEELAYHVQSTFLSRRNAEEEEGCSSGKDPVRQKLESLPALVLNADYQPLKMLPLSTWSWQDTVRAVYSGKVVVVDVYPDVVVRAVKEDMPVPSVIALREYAPAGKARPAFTRRNVFLRDGYRCQYCTKLFRTSDLSLDHVEPRCLGGKLTWDNTVTSCRKCNGRKGSLRPSELHMVGMSLKKEPRCPSIYELANNAQMFVPRRVHPSWAPFLGIDIEEVTEDSPSRGANGKRSSSRKLP